ncbi:MAG TPA: acetyl-coenzyme A synthetase N-terminal domain-containing protein, partial [Candidatus Binataceae bacterium]|nr:acetyl-coenzyme A synthetase N-terminal domain-containing protein [Candidatus Binataceae bacterium]
MAAGEASHIESVLTEARSFEPPAEFSAKAWVKSRAEYNDLYKRASEDPEGFWAECARSLHWFKPFTKTLEWKFPFAKWFIGGELNAAYNCLDRHLAGPRRNKAALIW